MLFDSLFNYATHFMLHIDFYIASVRILRKLKSNSIDSVKALCKLRDEGCIGNDVALLLDEMHLQQQVKFDGQDIIGCNENLEMFKSILCLMIISLKETVRYVIKAVPIVKLSSDIILDWILNCLKVLSDANFQPQCIISDNHQSNISAFNKFKKGFPIDSKNYCMRNPFITEE